MKLKLEEEVKDAKKIQEVDLQKQLVENQALKAEIEKLRKIIDKEDDMVKNVCNANLVQE